MICFLTFFWRRGLVTHVAKDNIKCPRPSLAENFPAEQVAGSESAKPSSPRRDSAAKRHNAEFELDRTLFKKVRSFQDRHEGYIST